MKKTVFHVIFLTCRNSLWGYDLNITKVLAKAFSRRMYMMYWNGMSGGWMIFGGLLMLLFWGGVIWAIVWGVRRAGHHTYRGETMSPLDIAKARYAKGEITKDQFDQLKKDL
jgi:putative membrane protein